MISRERLDEAIRYSKYLCTDFAHVGIRTQFEPFELGPISHTSHVWDDGEDTGETLGGISTTDATSAYTRMHTDTYNSFEGYYPGGHTAIIAGNEARSGEDPGELVIMDPVVITIIQ